MAKVEADDTGAGRSGTRQRILAVAMALLTEGGRDAVSTRAVGAGAGVQAPTIYRIFGDKQGLLDALADHGFAEHVRLHLAPVPGPDPVRDLRIGWDLHVAFGLAHPYLYSLMYGDPRPGRTSPAALHATKILAERMHRVAAAGRLLVAQDHAVRLLHAAGSGTALALIAMPPDRRDLGLSDLARDSIIGAITTDADGPQDAGLRSAAVQLRAHLSRADALSPGELALLAELLDRIAGVSAGRRPEAAAPR